MRSIRSYTDLPNCVAWFDSLDGVTLSGDRAIALADQSEAGLAGPISVAQAIAFGLAAAVGPVYLESDPLFSDKPSLLWGGPHGDTCLDTAQLATDLEPPITFMACGLFDGTTNQSVNGRNLFAGAPGSVSAARRCSMTSPSTSAVGSGAPADGLFAVFGFTSTPAASLRMNVLQPFVMAMSFNSGKDFRALANGRIVQKINSAGTMRTHCGYRLGRSGSNAVLDANWPGRINAFVAWNSFLSDGQVRMASEFMMHRQGVALTARSAAPSRTALPVPGSVGGRQWIL